MNLVLHAEIETGILTDNIGQYLIEEDGNFQGGASNYFLYDMIEWKVDGRKLSITGKHASIYKFDKGYKLFKDDKEALDYAHKLTNSMKHLEVWIISDKVNKPQIIIKHTT